MAQKTLYLRICGLPLSVVDSAVYGLLDKLKFKFTCKILYEKISHPSTNRMTSILTGTRFIYIELLPDGKHLPIINYCGGIQCKLFHFDQPKTPQICSAQIAGKLITFVLDVHQKPVARCANNLEVPMDMRRVLTFSRKSI